MAAQHQRNADLNGEVDVHSTYDGTGLPTPGDHGNGLAIMRERAEELGGTATVTGTSPGVIVAARLPLLTAPVQVSPVPAVPA